MSIISCIHFLLVVGIFFFQFFYQGLQFLHLLHASIALDAQRVEYKLDEDCQQNNIDAVVVGKTI